MTLTLTITLIGICRVVAGLMGLGLFAGGILALHDDTASSIIGFILVVLGAVVFFAAVQG